MAIQRIDIGRSLANLKAALEATGLFYSMDYNDESNPTVLRCYDADGNTLFTVTYIPTATNPTFAWRAYKSNGSYIEVSTPAASDSTFGVPSYLYIVGTDTAVIHFANSVSRAAFIVIGKTTTGTIGFVLTTGLSNSTTNSECDNLRVASWDDDGSMDGLLYVTNGQSPMVGNSSLLVPIPLHGAYNTPICMKSAYFMPIAQNGMRRVVQEIVGSDGKTYLTNGEVAIKDA